MLKFLNLFKKSSVIPASKDVVMVVYCFNQGQLEFLLLEDAGRQLLLPKIDYNQEVDNLQDVIMHRFEDISLMGDFKIGTSVTLGNVIVNQADKKINQRFVLVQALNIATRTKDSTDLYRWLTYKEATQRTEDTFIIEIIKTAFNKIKRVQI